MTDETAAKILEVLRSTEPHNLRKVQLLEMRRRVLDLVLVELGEPVELPPVVIEPDPQYVLALKLALSYEGANRFMKDMKTAASVYGTLTEKQAAWVTTPPLEANVEAMVGLGIDPSSVTYNWQAIDAISEARQRAKAQALQELADG